MLLCLFLIITKLIIAPWEVAAITNKRPSIATTEYSGNVRYFRHVAAGPSSGQLGDWEIGLREAIHQALLREGYWEPNLSERLTNAQLIGRRDQATPFGDVAILARGQLYNIQSGNFMLLQDSYQNDCDDCYNPRRCERHDCQPYSPHNQEILVALWTVKRLRHRDGNGVRFEIEYIVSPINSNNNLIIMRRNRFNYAVPGHVFVIRNDQNNKKYSEVFNRKVPKNNFRQEVALGIDSEGYKKILYSYPGFYTSIPAHYLPPASDNREEILYKKLLEVLSSKTTSTQKQDDVSHIFPTTTKPLPNVQEEIPKAAIAPTTPTTSTTTSTTEISTFPPKTTMKTIITYFMPFGDEILMPQSDITTDTIPSTRLTTTSTSTIRTSKQPTTSTTTKKFFTKITAKKPTKTTFSTTLMPKTTKTSTSTTTQSTTSTKRYYSSKQTKTTTKKPTKTTISTTALPKTTATTRKSVMLTTKYVQPSTSRTTSTSITPPSVTKLKPTSRPTYKSTSSTGTVKTTSYTVINKPSPITPLFTKLTTLSNTLVSTTTKSIPTIISQVPSTEITTTAPTNTPSLLTTEYQMAEENTTIKPTTEVFTETITPFTIMLTTSTTTEPSNDDDIAFEMSTIHPTEPMIVQSVTPSTEIPHTTQTTDANIENSERTFTPLESSPITSSEFTTSLPEEVITDIMQPTMQSTDYTTETTISLLTTTSESPPTTNLPTTASMLLTTTEAPTTKEWTTIEAPTKFEITTITQKTTTPSDFLTETEPYNGPVYVGSVKNDYSLDDIFGPTTPTSKSTSVSTTDYTESDISQQLFGGNLPQDAKVIFSNFYEASTDKNEDNRNKHEFSTSQSYETSISLEVNKRNLGESSTYTKKVTKNRAFTINQNGANLKKYAAKNKLLNMDKNDNLTNSAPSKDVEGMIDISIHPVEETMSITDKRSEVFTKNEPVNKMNIMEMPTKAEVVKMQTNLSDFVVYKAEYPNELAQQKQTQNNQEHILDDLALRLVNHAKSLEYLTKSNNTLKVPKYKRKPYVPRSKRPANKRNERNPRKTV